MLVLAGVRLHEQRLDKCIEQRDKEREIGRLACCRAKVVQPIVDGQMQCALCRTEVPREEGGPDWLWIDRRMVQNVASGLWFHEGKMQPVCFWIM